MFIPEQILWGKDKSGEAKTVVGYLDFPETTHNSLCSDIYRVTLVRVLGVLPQHKIELYPLDRLTAPILREIHAAEVYEPSTDSAKLCLALGSVLVSGSTLESSPSSPIDLHFFVHRSSPLRGKKPALLFWLPQTQMKKTAPMFARIGRTSSIAPEGWKSFEVPRFDSQRKCVGARNPQETYKDWQSLSPVIFKIGHWSYEGHHDFLTVNIASAVEAAFLGKKELARFLVSRILTFIGVNKDHIDQNWQRMFDQNQNYTYNRVHPQENYGLLVYRSHPSSDLIIRRLLDILTPEGRKLALSRIFPILPVRLRWSGSTFLIPPLVREDIRKALNFGGETHPILLFDDAAITGRTLQDLRAALSAIGATQISTVVIANRLRQPADGLGNERLDYYWRLDVPVMGHQVNCPLCHALHLAETFSGLLAATIAKREIQRWRHLWGETSPLDNWSAGLRPLPLSTSKRGTRYCYRQNLSGTKSEDEKHLAIIDLIRSTGLAIHITELHAMTGRDDYCLKKIYKHKEPEIRVEIAASQILLFGNEFDLDIRLELIKTLIRELSLLKEDSPHAPLAGLSIIGGLTLLEKESKMQAAEIVHEEGWRRRTNYVTKVLLAYLTSEKLIEESSEAYKIGKSLLTTASWSLAQRFRAWFLEILSPLGNAHSEAIPLLLDELAKGEPIKIKNEWIKDAMDSLDFLLDIANRLERIFVRKEESEAYPDKIQEMERYDNTARRLLSQKTETERVVNWRQETKTALFSYLKSMKALAGAYFNIIPSAKEYHRDRTFETVALDKIIRRINWEKASAGKSVESVMREIKLSHAGEINFDCNAGEVWIPWHRFICGIVMDLLRNAVYAKGQIIDPWNSMENRVADIWVRVDYEKKFLKLNLANGIFSCLKQHRWSYLKDFGGSVEFLPLSQKDILGMCIQIPYAAYLE
jgi:hypothetical protein